MFPHQSKRLALRIKNRLKIFVEAEETRRGLKNILVMHALSLGLLRAIFFFAKVLWARPRADRKADKADDGVVACFQSFL
jgi:hypothetical protein